MALASEVAAGLAARAETKVRCCKDWLEALILEPARRLLAKLLDAISYRDMKLWGCLSQSLKNLGKVWLRQSLTRNQRKLAPMSGPRPSVTSRGRLSSHYSPKQRPRISYTRPRPSESRRLASEQERSITITEYRVIREW